MAYGSHTLQCLKGSPQSFSNTANSNRACTPFTVVASAHAPPPKQWKKGPPKDNSSAERDFLAKARALQEAEDSACALPSHTYTPIYSYRWDHTLGFEGEGPPLNLVSLNCNGVLSNDTWQTLLKLAQFLKVDILCLQEPNIPVGDTRITRFEPTQSSTPSNPTWV